MSEETKKKKGPVGKFLDRLSEANALEHCEGASPCAPLSYEKGNLAPQNLKKPSTGEGIVDEESYYDDIETIT